MIVLFLAYLALATFAFGLAWKIWVYYKSPAPLKIPTTPAPVTKLGVRWRLFTETAMFSSLFKGNKWTWLFAIAFHLALFVVIVRHFRYFIKDLPSFFSHIQIFGVLAGFVLVGALFMLLVRRYWVDRTRYISSFADYFFLVLLLAIGASGLLMKFVFRPDIVEIKTAMIGWITFQGFETPGDALFLVHFVLVLLLMAVFPFSKLTHAIGLFFSPTRNQVDNPREVRHVNPWANN